MDGGLCDADECRRGRQGLKGHWEITEVEPSRKRRFQGRPPGCAACTGSEAFETVESGTDYTVEMDNTLRVGPFGVALDRVFGRSFFERVVERNIEGLRGMVEE